MWRHILCKSALVALLVVAGRVSGAEPTAVRKPDVEDFGNGRLRIGAVVLDRKAGSFSVPGRVIRLEPPLEYLASTRGGMKAYETLLELGATAFEFNTACILLGLDAGHAVRPKFQFDEHRVAGDAVGIFVSWRDDDGAERSLPAESLLKRGDSPVEKARWIYTGSLFEAGNRYLAQANGTLVGFVHDPSSIIEHAEGLGLGQYGLIGGNPEQAPPVGTGITLTVSRNR